MTAKSQKTSSKLASEQLSASAESRTKSETAKKTAVEAHPKIKFAQGLCFKKLFFIFLIGSVLGTIYEDLLIFWQTYHATGTGVWMTHRGVIYGPFNVIYGFGAAVMCWVLLRKKLENWQIFVYSAFLGGFVEYALSFLQEMSVGTTSWDYSHQFLNFQGRTSVPIMLVWGLMGLILVKVIYPLLSNLIERIPIRTGNILFLVLLVFMTLNCLVSWSALIRQNLRHQGVGPWTPIGEFYDKYYPDDYLHRFYPNMVRQEGK